ncbi:MAG: transcription elongation factor GreB [Betaproteobacteria bacterium]|nr:transcription elongation factor GreB [Betaproteobacteria bacterium]
MSKAFTRETDGDDDDLEASSTPIPTGGKNYITPLGHQRLKDELLFLLDRDRPAVTAAVSWAAKNGDRSENADYQYGKKRLREIDRRIRFLSKRLDNAEVVDPAAPRDQELAEQVFFGATVTYSNAKGEENTVTIVGIDEIDLGKNHISWVSPLARALMKARAGDTVVLRAPGGVEELEVTDVRYGRVEVDPFVPLATHMPNDKAS